MLRPFQAKQRLFPSPTLRQVESNPNRYPARGQPVRFSRGPSVSGRPTPGPRLATPWFWGGNGTHLRKRENFLPKPQKNMVKHGTSSPFITQKPPSLFFSNLQPFGNRKPSATSPSWASTWACGKVPKARTARIGRTDRRPTSTR